MGYWDLGTGNWVESGSLPNTTSYAPNGSITVGPTVPGAMPTATDAGLPWMVAYEGSLYNPQTIQPAFTIPPPPPGYSIQTPDLTAVMTAAQQAAQQQYIATHGTGAPSPVPKTPSGTLPGGLPSLGGLPTGWLIVGGIGVLVVLFFATRG